VAAKLDVFQRVPREPTLPCKRHTRNISENQHLVAGDNWSLVVVVAPICMIRDLPNRSAEHTAQSCRLLDLVPVEVLVAAVEQLTKSFWCSSYGIAL